MEDTLFLRDLAIVLLCATVAGWLLQRIGFSSVVGYILAGIFIGPFSPLFPLVSDLDHINFLAQIGLVFLMFSIGLGLSLARLQRMGTSILVAVIISALLLFNVCRTFGSAMGWNHFQTFFLAGTLMISSSSIIIKVLDELNITHQRAGQLALGITVLEDMVAVVMLTLFMSLLKVGGAPEASLWETIGSLGVFVVFAVVVAMLLVPRILQALSRDPGPELRLMAVTALLLISSVAAVRSGYSVALGAFVLGMVLAGTRFKDEVGQAFGPLHHIFGAVFFVAVGMMFDFRLLAEVWGLVLVVTLVTVVVRPLACAAGLVAVGHSNRNALKAGLALTPIGEFAFVMIQVGKSANVLPETFYALAIGVSLATAAIGPALTRRSEAICSWVEAHEPRPWRDLVSFYHRQLAKLHGHRNRSLIWRLASRKLMQSALHLLFVSALILFSKPLHALLVSHVGSDWLIRNGVSVLFWVAFCIVLIGPLIVIWRDVQAIAMILAEGVALNRSLERIIRPVLRTLIQAVGLTVLIAWMLLLVPFGPWVFWTVVLALGALLLFAPLFWRRLVTLHSRLEVDVRKRLRAASTLGSTTGLPISVLERPQQWDLQIDEVILPIPTEHAGRRIAEVGIRARFGTSIVAIERQGFLIANPGGEERVFAGDKLLLLGPPDQLAETEQFFRGNGGDSRSSEFADITMESVDVPEPCELTGRALSELDLVTRFGVQVCGIERQGRRILVPTSAEQICAGDRLLVLSTHARIEAFRAAMDVRGMTQAASGIRFEPEKERTPPSL